MTDTPTGMKPDFNHIVSTFAMQAVIACGAIPNPVTGKAEKDMRAAQYFIEVLGLLQDKTKGNLTPEEDRNFDATIHQVRMAFVQAGQGEQA